MADIPDDVTEEVSSSQGQQTHEVGESSRPPQTEEEIFRTQLVAAVTMFTQVMQNPRFMALLQPPPPSQPVGTQKQKSEPVKAQPQVIHTVESMETPVHLSETMQSPKPLPDVQEQVAETPVFQAVPVQPATFQQPIAGSNGQGSNLQAMQQVFPPPSVHPGYFRGESVFQSMAGHAPRNQFYTLGTVFGGAQMMMPNPMYNLTPLEKPTPYKEGGKGVTFTTFTGFDDSRTNFIELAMLPKGEWPNWCGDCKGSGLDFCDRCLGSGEKKGVMGFHVNQDEGMNGTN
ncbi:hypothetical protein L7F22_015389 [Adiantum nelumboides]|nr:hypothetical protein [Adiantum nelumboides]